MYNKSVMNVESCCFCQSKPVDFFVVLVDVAVVVA